MDTNAPSTALKERASWSRLLKKAEDENARLRTALQQIADFRPAPGDWLPHEQIAVFAKDTARAALVSPPAA